MPSPSKPVEHLDPTPELWPEDHPPLLEASRPRVNAAYLQDLLVFVEVDLWPFIVQQNIAADEVGPEKLMSYAKRCGGPALVDFCFSNWDKLQGIIAKSWKAEKVEEFVQISKQVAHTQLYSVSNLQASGTYTTLRTDRTVIFSSSDLPTESCLNPAKTGVIKQFPTPKNRSTSFFLRLPCISPSKSEPMAKELPCLLIRPNRPARRAGINTELKCVFWGMHIF